MLSSCLTWFRRDKNNPRRIQLVSDLHLEVGKQYSTFQIPVEAPYLILAGEIGQLRDYQMYLDFLIEQCNRFLQVFLVLGNHEFYGGSRPDGLRLAAKLEQEAAPGGRLVILNRRRVNLSSRVTILGCTLHSHISSENRAVVQSKVKDFTRIEEWSISDHNAEHKADVEWLRSQIFSIQNKENKESGLRRRILVVTHHAPIRRGSSQPRDEDNPWSEVFATDLIGVDNVTSLPNVEWWIFGHTHYTTTCSRHGTKLVSNQRGYILPQRRVESGPPARTVTEKPKSSSHLQFRIRSLLHQSKHQFNVRKSIKV